MNMGGVPGLIFQTLSSKDGVIFQTLSSTGFYKEKGVALFIT
jgi:hypothetical protein